MGEITKQPSGPDLALIKKFSRPRDRRYPPVFVGRKKEIEIVEENCQDVLDFYRQGKKTGGHIVLFRGAPGAGKSSLLEHVAECWSGKPDCPQTLDIELDTLEDPAAVAWEIVKKVAPENEEVFRQRIVTNTSGSAGVPGIASGRISTTTDTAPAKISFSVLKELLSSEHWKQPLCLLADEIQTVTKRHGTSLLTLHRGAHGLPIVLVGAGLADSAEKLQQAMSSRLTGDNLRTLGALAPDEVHSCVRQMFDRCRVNYTAGQLKQFAGEIAERSEGWPQHVRTGTAALFGELDKTQGDLGSVDAAAVKQRADTYRENSYLERQSEAMRWRGNLVANILKMIPEAGAPPEHVLRLIAAKANEKGPEPRGLPPGMNPEDFLDHLIHQGIFQPDKTGMLSYPIPSLRNWLIKRPEAMQARFDQESERASWSVFDTRMEKWAEQFKPDRKHRSGPDRDRGAGR